jgi:hypothetical protein
MKYGIPTSKGAGIFYFMGERMAEAVRLSLRMDEIYRMMGL